MKTIILIAINIFALNSFAQGIDVPNDTKLLDKYDVLTLKTLSKVELKQRRVYNLDSNHDCKVRIEFDEESQSLVIIQKAWNKNCPTTLSLAGPYDQKNTQSSHEFKNQTCSKDSVRAGGFFAVCYMKVFLMNEVFTVTFYRSYYNLSNTLTFVSDELFNSN